MAACRKLENEEETEARQLCRELLELRLEHREVFERIDAINAELKQRAGEQADNKLREVFPGLGQVSAYGEKPPREDGIHPAVVESVFYGLPKEAARGLSQKKLLEAGVIKEQLRMTNASYGGVRPKLFPQAA